MENYGKIIAKASMLRYNISMKKGSWRKPAERKRDSVLTRNLIWIMPT